MTNAWDEMKKANEEQYFERQNQEALRKLHDSQSALLSPRTQKPMEQIKVGNGKAYVCPASHGLYIESSTVAEFSSDPEALGAAILKAFKGAL
jgi:hypothetical protein